jgi:hypothetical protein
MMSLSSRILRSSSVLVRRSGHGVTAACTIRQLSAAPVVIDKYEAPRLPNDVNVRNALYDEEESRTMGGVTASVRKIGPNRRLLRFTTFPSYRTHVPRIYRPSYVLESLGSATMHPT